MNLEQLRKQAKERVRAGREPKLALAREHGYASWPALVHALEADPVSFVLAATGGNRTRAEALLAARSEIARDPWARLVLGRGWDGDANEPGGPRGWAPLLYVCHSVYASAPLARELLERGADPDATFENEVRRGRGPEFVRLLVERGAELERPGGETWRGNVPLRPRTSTPCCGTAPT